MWDALWRNGKVARMTEGTPFGLIERGPSLSTAAASPGWAPRPICREGRATARGRCMISGAGS
jgi:hypothetical protein